MPKFECFLLPSWTSEDVEASTAEEAKDAFIKMLRDNLSASMVGTNELEDEDN